MMKKRGKKKYENGSKGMGKKLLKWKEIVQKKKKNAKNKRLRRIWKVGMRSESE